MIVNLIFQMMMNVCLQLMIVIPMLPVLILRAASNVLVTVDTQELDKSAQASGGLFGLCMVLSK